MNDTQPVTDPREEPTPDPEIKTPPPEEPPVEESPAGEQPLAAFGADLTKEEFVDFSLSAGRDPRRTRHMRILSAVSTGVMTALCLYYLLLIWQETGTVDAQITVLLVLVVALGLLSLFGLPALYRRRAEKQYEESVKNGYSYRGAVRVFARHVEKETAERRTTILLNRETRFLEREDVMALAQPGSPALILYARYLTEETAAQLRQVVLDNLPPENCQLLSRLRPTATAPLPVPTFAEKEEETPQRFFLRYTAEEGYALTKETVYTVFSHQLPLMGGTALVGGVALWLAADDPVLGAAVFAAVLLFGYLSRVFFPLRRAKRALQQNPETSASLILSVTSRELILTGEARNAVSMPWKAVTRAVSEPDYIRLYTKGSQLMIPKRCLPDVEEFCRMVDRYMEQDVDPRGES